MKKILLSAMAIVLTVGLVGAGAFAFFSDVETSTGNTFTAGTIDLTLGQSGGAPINFPDMKPGNTASGTLTVTNIGNNGGLLYASSWYVEADGTQPAEFPINKSADDVAKMLQITAFTADGFNMLSRTDLPRNADGDGTDFTVYDMVNDPSGVSLPSYADPSQGGHGWYSYDTNMLAGAIHTYTLTVTFDPNAGNDYQGDGITWTLQFLLTQK